MLVDVLALVFTMALLAARAAPPSFAEMITLLALLAELALAPHAKVRTG